MAIRKKNATRKKAARKKAARKKAGAKQTTRKKAAAVKAATRVAHGDVDYETVRAIGLALPGIEEGLSYGTPALRVRGKLLVRLREDPDSLMVRADPETRDFLMQAEPAAFYTTDHYRGYDSVLVRLSMVVEAQLATLIEDAWRRAAPKKLVAAYDAKGV